MILKFKEEIKIMNKVGRPKLNIDTNLLKAEIKKYLDKKQTRCKNI